MTTTENPVSPERVAIAEDFGLKNVEDAASACRVAGIPFWAACALLDKESGGRNVYGHDRGGALSGFPDEVDRSNYRVFRWLVENGQTSNGVGPCQITWPGHFSAMSVKGLRPWVPLDNMIYGFTLLREHYDKHGTWREAGTAYNGAESYGLDFVAKCNEWRDRFGFRGDVR